MFNYFTIQRSIILAKQSPQRYKVQPVSTRRLLKTDALAQLLVPCVLLLPEFSQVLETDFSMHHTQNKAVPDQ